MRVEAQDVPVLAGAGLRLVGVEHQIGRAAVGLLGHEGPLEARREAGAAAPAQVRLLDLVDDCVAAALQQGLGVVPQAPRACAWQAPILGAVEVAEDAVAVLQHGRSAYLSPVSVVGPPTGAEPCRPVCEPGFGASPPRASAVSSFSSFAGSRSS